MEERRTCKKCGAIKPLVQMCTYIYKGVRTYRHTCLECQRQYHRIWNRKNSDEVSARCAAWRRANPQKFSDSTERWRSANPEKVVENTARYRARKKCASPPWITSDHICIMQGIYQHARDCTIVTGEEYHVDHIVPLQGKTVCGLHVPWNLQVLPSDVNKVKGNKLSSN